MDTPDYPEGVTSEGGKTGSEPTSPRRFGQLPGLVVSDGFDEPLPEDDWPTRVTNKAGEPHSLTIDDLRRAADAAVDVDDPGVMASAWRHDSERNTKGA
jgi:hypothetical protein